MGTEGFVVRGIMRCDKTGVHLAPYILVPNEDLWHFFVNQCLEQAATCDRTKVEADTRTQNQMCTNQKDVQVKMRISPRFGTGAHQGGRLSLKQYHLSVHPRVSVILPGRAI